MLRNLFKSKTHLFNCSGDTKPVEASDVLKKSDVTPGRVGRRAKRQASNQSQNSIFDGK